MKKNSGFQAVPLPFARQMVAASSTINKKYNTIHSIVETDITIPRQIIRQYKEKTGESLSLTAYVVTCLARTISQFPRFNSFIKGKKLIVLDDVTISVLVEREIEGENVPEPFGISKAQSKSYRQIHDEIRAAQKNRDDQLGSLSGIGWVRFIPASLLRLFIRLASRNINMAKRYGKTGVTAVGMFSNEASWFIPLSGATVLVTVGSINKKAVFIDGNPEEREHLCLTVSFDHDIVDGAPAARFVKCLTESIKNGEELKID